MPSTSWLCRSSIIDRPFYLGIYPVTQRQWQTLMGSNPSHFEKSGGDLDVYPVENVSS